MTNKKKTLEEGIEEFVQCLWDNNIDMGQIPDWTPERVALWNKVVKPPHRRSV